VKLAAGNGFGGEAADFGVVKFARSASLFPLKELPMIPLLLPDPVEQLRRLGASQHRTCDLAAYLPSIASTEQEIDCKLQSISR
jgi:hypothetical protein